MGLEQAPVQPAAARDHAPFLPHLSIFQVSPKVRGRWARGEVLAPSGGVRGQAPCPARQPQTPRWAGRRFAVPPGTGSGAFPCGSGFERGYAATCNLQAQKRQWCAPRSRNKLTYKTPPPVVLMAAKFEDERASVPRLLF